MSPSFASRGGTDAWLVEVATRFSTRHEVHLLTQTYAPELVKGITVHRVPSLGRPVPALGRYLSYLLLASWAAGRLGSQFDIVHATGGDSLIADVVTANYCQAERLRLVREKRIEIEGKGRAAGIDRTAQQMYIRLVPKF